MTPSENKITALHDECYSYHCATLIFECYKNYSGNSYCITSTTACENEEEETTEYFLSALHYYQTLCAFETITARSLGDCSKEDETALLSAIKSLAI